MVLLMGADDGIHRTTELPFDAADHVLESGPVARIKTFEGVDGIFASTMTGLYRSMDDGRSWDRLGIGDHEIWGITVLDSGVIFAGSGNSSLYRSDDNGRNWRTVPSFEDIQSHHLWISPVHPYAARVRVVVNPPGDRNCLVVGIEGGGLHMSEDAGESWTEIRSPALRRRIDDELQDDVHQLYPIDRDTWIVPTGRLDILSATRSNTRGGAGVYITRDRGATWERLDRNDGGLHHPYSREVITHDGRLYYCGSSTRPRYWRHPEVNSAQSAMFESDDLGQTWERVPFPGEPDELVMGWTVEDDAVIAGLGSFGTLEEGEFYVTGSVNDHGRVLRRESDGWKQVGELFHNIHAMHSV